MVNRKKMVTTIIGRFTDLNTEIRGVQKGRIFISKEKDTCDKDAEKRVKKALVNGYVRKEKKLKKEKK